MKNEKIMEQGTFGQLILRLSVPSMIVIVVMILYNLADTFFIGQTGDPNKIAAISICMPIFTILSGIGTLFGIGGGTSISIALGEKKYDKIRTISGFCSVCSLAVGIAYGAAVIAFARPLCLALGAEEEFLSDAMTYLRVFALSSPFVLFSQAYGNILRSDGEAATPMIASLSGTLLNIVLDGLFVLVFSWDVFGAAFATVLGNAMSFALVIWILKCKKPEFMPQLRGSHLHGTAVDAGQETLLTGGTGRNEEGSNQEEEKRFCGSFRKEIVLPVMTLGLPMTFSTILSSVSSAVQNRLMVAHGSTYLAAQSVAGKLGLIVTMLIMGFCMGMQPAISYNYGSKNDERMYEIRRKMMLVCVLAGGMLAGLIVVFRRSMVGVFIQDENVIACGELFVIASVCVGPVYAIYQTCQTFLQATGKATYAIVVSLLDKGLVFLPVLFLMDYLFGATGIAFSHAVTMVLSVVIAILLTARWGKEISADHAKE